MNASIHSPLNQRNNIANSTDHQTLDTLASMSVQELGQLYARGGVPDSLEVLDGSPQGRMLAIAGTGRGMLAKGLRRVAASSGFPWGGKSFSSSSPREGRGINRVRLGGRHLLFPFQTEFCASRIDDRPTIRLDYDLDDNPGIIRRIHDEIREIQPGLFLGPAMWKSREKVTFVLWFALDTHIQAKPLRWGDHG